MGEAIYSEFWNAELTDMDEDENPHPYKPAAPGTLYEELINVIDRLRNCGCDEAYTEACRLAGELYGCAAINGSFRT